MSSASSSVRRIAAIVLAAGAIVSAAALPAAAADGDDRHHQQRPRVEISRVQADSPGRDDRSNRSLNGEWVEITNTTRTDLFQDRRDYVWDNRSDTATLRDDRGRTVDSETWGRRR
ncbi:lamin tail domain-containing protein [Streptomyces sp. NBC_00029]|uniref:lamin tail domain-containing protein n=1 Tax=Streptomyces sp. NBC_00029 TaxID=2903613 RepID=UPI00324D64D6